MSFEAPQSYVVVRSAEHLYALPLTHVDETMRPLAVRPVSGVSRFVLGVSVIRGVPVPVVDVAAVVGTGQVSSRVTRFVTLKLGDRRAALAVDEVIGVHPIDDRQLSTLPPLLKRADEEVVSAIGRVDDELLMVLRTGRLVPGAIWSALDAGEPS